MPMHLRDTRQTLPLVRDQNLQSLIIVRGFQQRRFHNESRHHVKNHLINTWSKARGQLAYENAPRLEVTGKLKSVLHG